jgi:hypothetical protein
MTLVLICLSAEYIVHVSDRRLTSAANELPTSEHTNKAIFLDGRYIFGFTGLAQLGGKRADLWFAQEIQQTEDAPLVDRLLSLGRSLPAAVRYAPPKYRAHAFVGAGFARSSKAAPVEPVAVMLSNFLNPHGRPRQISPAFAVSWLRLAERKDFMVLSAGAELTLTERATVNRLIRKARKAEASIEAIARILAEMVWKVAQRKATVGKSLMICTLPRRALGGDGEAAEYTSGGIAFNRDDAAFYFLGPETAQGIQFGPTSVTRGMMFTDFRMSFGTADKPAVSPPEIAAIHYQGPDGSKTPDDALCPCGSGVPYKGCHSQP